MKKIILTLAIAGMALGASAQDKGRFEVHDLDNFRLHVYYTNDALGDASYIIEGKMRSLRWSSRFSKRTSQSSMIIS